MPVFSGNKKQFMNFARKVNETVANRINEMLVNNENIYNFIDKFNRYNSVDNLTLSANFRNWIIQRKMEQNNKKLPQNSRDIIDIFDQSNNTVAKNIIFE